MNFKAIFKTAFVLLLFAALALGLLSYARKYPENLPWTKLDLTRPIGTFTGRKHAGLTHDAPRCQALLDDVGVAYSVLPPVHEGRCGYSDAVRISSDGLLGVGWHPPSPGLSCPVAAALVMWEREVVQPAAQLYFKTKVTDIEHYGSYNCRRIYGRSEAAWSEHATADALDVAGLRFANGMRITVRHDWKTDSTDATFLHTIREGAGSQSYTTLTPAHKDTHDHK